ncbi:MAG: methyltransferase domain-containing protein [Nanoarchaeales archaeon]|nr:methyltransferase domain-containing protein [Nanoarchaeales archaeon]
MKYYFLNYLDLGKADVKIVINSEKEVVMKKLSKSHFPVESWTYKNIYVNGVKKSISEIWNIDICDGSIKVGNKFFKIRDYVLINETAIVKDINKTRNNWENWWTKIRKKSDVDLYDKLWVESERKLDAEPLFVESDFKNKVVMDAGCGVGRYEPLFSKFGAKNIIAVDLGKQVFKVYSQEMPKENIHPVQSDLMSLPFKKEIFDTVASHGVLHHTPNPYKTFKNISNYLKIGGVQAIYVYHKEWWHFSAHSKSYFVDFAYSTAILIWQSIRKITSRMPHWFIIGFCYLLACKGTVDQSLKNSNSNFLQILGKISFSIPPICFIGVNFHERVVRNYDHYSATFNYFQTIDEVTEWFRLAGFSDLSVASIPVSIRGTKYSKIQEPIKISLYKYISHFEFRELWERMYKK